MPLNRKTKYRFDDFCLDGQERLLARAGVPVPLGPKVFDLLHLLVENGGALVERSTIREQLWPDQIVEDGTLSRAISDLRKALGDTGDERRHIETVPKFGYRFLTKVEAVRDERLTAEPEIVPAKQASPVVGRGTTPYPLRRIAAGLAFLCLVGVTMVMLRARQANPVQSLLILPFQVIGNLEEAEMLELGLQDSLTMELSGLSRLAVIKLPLPPTTDSPVDPAELGRRHRTGFVLAGTIKLSNNRIIVNTRLLRSDTGLSVWTHQFDEQAEDVLLVQSKLAKLTVAELLPSLPGAEGKRLDRKLSTNSAADRYYLLGRHYWNKRDEHAYSDAIEMFQKATVADPAYAAASVGLADSYMLASGTHVDRLSQDLPRAKKALEKAIQIDQELGEAHASMAMIAESYDFDWRTAEREFRTAIRLAPNYLTGHHWYAEFLTMTGRFRESEAEFEVARNLDPASMIVLTDLAQLYNFEKKYRRSLETLDEALKIDPSFHLAHYRKAYALMLMRRPQEAEDEFQMGGHELSMSERAWVAAVAGKRQQAVELASRAEKDHPDLFVLCVAWTELRNLDRAFQLLEGLCDRRMGGVVSIKVNPVFDALRSDARFSGMLRRVNLN